MEISEFISSLPVLIGNAVETNQWIGYGAILLAMFLENLIPPIPSELIMPLGGFYVAQGQLDFFPVVLAGLIGTVIGALPWYGIGRLVNEEKLEKWISPFSSIFKAIIILLIGVGLIILIYKTLRKLIVN